MTISTYAQLQTAILNWTKRADLSDYTADFITIGEARIGREVRSRLQEQRVTSTLSSTTPYVNVPSDFLKMRAAFLTASGLIKRLEYWPPDAFLMKFSTAASDSQPTHFTIFGDEMRFGPWPDSNYTVELWYYKRLTALSTEVNSLFTSNPDLYLYASLAAAMPFMKDDKRVLLWETQYQSLRDQVNDTEEEGRRADGALQMIPA